MRVLTCFSRMPLMSFEEAVYTRMIRNGFSSQGHEVINFDPMTYLGEYGLTATFIYLYKEIAKVDLVIIPMTENGDIDLILDPEKVGTAKVCYVLTGDFDVVGLPLYRKIHPDFFVVATSFEQAEALHDYPKVLRLFPPVDPAVFFYDRVADVPETLPVSGEAAQKKLLAQHNIQFAFFGKRTVNREDFLARLVEAKLDVRAYGDGWWDFETFELKGIKTAPRKNLSFEREILSRATFAICFTEQLKSIVFEAIMCECLPLVFKGSEFKKIDLDIPEFIAVPDVLKIVEKFPPEIAWERAKELKKTVMENFTGEKFFNRMYEWLRSF